MLKPLTTWASWIPNKTKARGIKFQGVSNFKGYQISRGIKFHTYDFLITKPTPIVIRDARFTTDRGNFAITAVLLRYCGNGFLLLPR